MKIALVVVIVGLAFLVTAYGMFCTYKIYFHSQVLIIMLIAELKHKMPNTHNAISMESKTINNRLNY